MVCYFLNCRSFISKSGKHCNLLQVASVDGSVSDFFISDEVASSFSNMQPFDRISLEISVSRGHVSVNSVESLGG